MLVAQQDIKLPSWQKKSHLRNESSSIPTLNSCPNEIQQDSLQQRNITASQAPCKAILQRESNMPSQATTSDDNGEEKHQGIGNH